MSSFFTNMQQETIDQKLKPISSSTGTSSMVPQKDPSSPVVKFSDDTARLQQINNIRKSSVGTQIKRVVDLLFETRKVFTAEQINQVCYVDVTRNNAVFDSLRNNVKIKYDGQYFSYKPKHELKDKHDLLVLIKKFEDGIAVGDLIDAYSTVREDLETLKDAGKIWMLSNSVAQEEIVYPNNFKVSLQIDDDLKKEYWKVELPADMIDIEKELKKNGIKPATHTAERMAEAQVYGIKSKSITNKKVRKLSKRTKLTNAHLPELIAILDNIP